MQKFRQKDHSRAENGRANEQSQIGRIDETSKYYWNSELLQQKQKIKYLQIRANQRRKCNKNK